MSDEEKTVSIQPDQGTESFGKNAYIAARDGQFDKQGFKSSLIAVIGLMASIMVAMWITSKTPRDLVTGKTLASPIVSRDDPVLNPRLFTERDLTNRARIISNADNGVRAKFSSMLKHQFERLITS